jgi:hypothetical protein
METATKILLAKRSMLALCIGTVLVATSDASARLLPDPTAWAASAPTVVVGNCDDDGAGSLRDTLLHAAEGDVVDLTQLDCSTITLTSGAIVFGQANVGVAGPGPSALTIDASASAGSSAFYGLNAAGTFHLDGMTVTGGSKYRSDATARGGCVHVEGNVTLNDVHVVDCFAYSLESALGGGVFAGGVAYLKDSEVTGNYVQAHLYASGGGVYALGGLQSSHSTIAHNAAASMTSVPSFGGGAFARGTSFVDSTTVNANISDRDGGLGFEPLYGETTTIISSTISGNTATRVGGVLSKTALYLYNSTIAFNLSTEWTDGTRQFAGGVYIGAPSVAYSSIIANNLSPGSPFPTADVTGADNTGFNGGNNDVMFCGRPCPNDTSHDDPGLHPLADNGGTTLTHRPTPGIWDAIGGANPLSLPWDQRGPGFPRQPVGQALEIGAIQPTTDTIFENGFD